MKGVSINWAGGGDARCTGKTYIKKNYASHTTLDVSAVTEIGEKHTENGLSLEVAILSSKQIICVLF